MLATMPAFAQGMGEQATTDPTVAVAITDTDASAAVAAAIAERWGMDASTVAIELISAAEWPAAGTPFRLSGSGRDGRWAVWFDEANAATQLLVRAGVVARVWTAAHDIERGVELEATDLSSVAGVLWGPPTASGPGVEPGWVTRRRIAKGEEIRRPAAEPPHAVKSGDDVTIEAVYGSITLTLAGRANGSAAIGEVVQIRAETGKRLEAVVVGPGLVRIGMVREER
jgi:flagella basal body P-ring formation protein FlgA